MVNLKLGDTIWLHVSKKLLSFHEYFFTPFEDMPKTVQQEFRHHSHTHANATVDSSNNDHTQPWTYQIVYCTVGSHTHSGTSDAANAHNHTNVVLSFGAASLGSPWWNHTHPITLVSMNAGGGAHWHTITSTFSSSSSRCRGAAYFHSHQYDGTFMGGGGGAAHTHTITGAVTSTADPAGTPLNHVHPFNISLDWGDSHNHGMSGWSADATDPDIGVHNHLAPAVSGAQTHQHTASGNSGWGGEAPPIAIKIGLHPSKPLSIILSE